MRPFGERVDAKEDFGPHAPRDGASIDLSNGEDGFRSDRKARVGKTSVVSRHFRHGPAPPLFRRFFPVNAAFLMLTSAWMAGADAGHPVPIPAPAPAIVAPAAPVPVAVEHAPPVVSSGSSCLNGGCASSASHEVAESGGHGKPGLFSKLKGKFHKEKSCEDCEEEKHEPVVCVPAPIAICRPEPTCTTCGTHQVGLFSKWKGKYSKATPAAPDAGCDSCAHSSEPTPVVSPVGPSYPIMTPTPVLVPLPLQKMEPLIPPSKEAPKKMPDKVSGLPISPIITPASNRSPIQIGTSDNPF